MRTFYQFLESGKSGNFVSLYIFPNGQSSLNILRQGSSKENHRYAADKLAKAIQDTKELAKLYDTEPVITDSRTFM